MFFSENTVNVSWRLQMTNHCTEVSTKDYILRVTSHFNCQALLGTWSRLCYWNQKEVSLYQFSFSDQVADSPVAVVAPSLVVSILSNELDPDMDSSVVASGSTVLGGDRGTSLGIVAS